MNRSFSEKETPLPQKNPIAAKEGRLRERLAAYFLSLSAGAPDNLSGHAKDVYRRMARRLAALELASVLQSAGMERPLQYGDAAALLRSIADAASWRCAQRGIPITTAVPDTEALLTFEPRLTALSVSQLFRDAAARKEGIAFQLVVQKNSLQVMVASGNGFHTAPTRRLIRETARLHRGAALFTEEKAAFSLKKGGRQSLSVFSPPSAEEFIQNPLSCVNLSLF